LQRLLATRGSAFLYDSSSGEADEHMKVELTTGLLSAMSKSLPPHRTFGENVGILHFTAPAAQDLLKAACGLVQKGHHNTWMAAAVEQVARSWPIQGVDIADLPWIEIDFPDDLDRACTHVWPQITGAFAPPALRTAA
jgi:choline kinase